MVTMLLSTCEFSSRNSPIAQCKSLNVVNLASHVQALLLCLPPLLLGLALHRRRRWVLRFEPGVLRAVDHDPVFAGHHSNHHNKSSPAVPTNHGGEEDVKPSNQLVLGHS